MKILIRKCDGCGVVTALDLDLTAKHKRDMQMIGQTVFEVERDVLTQAVNEKNVARCRCKKGRS